MIIDLHSHLLPNIDDGSKSYRASIRMAKETFWQQIPETLAIEQESLLALLG